MTSRTTASFRAALAALPTDTQKQARKAYLLFRDNPQHPSLHFKQVHTSKPIYSARISLSCRALGVLSGDRIVWFWIGSHDEYEQLTKRSK